MKHLVVIVFSPQFVPIRVGIVSIASPSEFHRKTPLFYVKAPVLPRLAQAQLIACRQVA